MARGAFPEAPWLVEAMRARGDVEVRARPGTPGFGQALGQALAERAARPRPPPARDDTTDRLAEGVLSGALYAAP